MENKNINQGRDFTPKQNQKKGFAEKVGEKMEQLGDKFSRKVDNTKEHFRDSQR